MKTDIKSDKDLEFDIFKTLIVIESDEDLTAVLRQKYGTEFKLIYTMAKGGMLKPEAEKYIKGIFDKIITKREDYIKKYNSVGNVDETLVKEKEVSLPKWYGKTKIESDIKASGGKVTEVQRAMLALNDIKNDFSKLTRKGISDMLGGTENLSDEDCRTIIATVATFRKKLKDIL